MGVRRGRSRDEVRLFIFFIDTALAVCLSIFLKVSGSWIAGLRLSEHFNRLTVWKCPHRRSKLRAAHLKLHVEKDNTFQIYFCDSINVGLKSVNFKILFRDCFLVLVPNRAAATLEAAVQQYVLPGTELWTDMWKGYSNLESMLCKMT